MAKLAFKLPDGVKVVSTEIIGDDVVVTVKESNKLHLEVGIASKSLNIMYGGSVIGSISNDGKCYILSGEGHRQTYLQWVADGMPVDHTEVKWRGKMYCINQKLTLMCLQEFCAIFNFKYAIYHPNCQDANIQRYPHNNTPIAY
jgi:hypothetical protein